jgi:hypothetical protein
MKYLRFLAIGKIAALLSMDRNSIFIGRRAICNKSNILPVPCQLRLTGTHAIFTLLLLPMVFLHQKLKQKLFIYIHVSDQNAPRYK